MVERVSAAEQLANCFTATGARVKNANTDSVFACVLGDAYKNVTAPSQEENPSQQVEARNTPEGIVKWLEHRDIYPEPDDKALVDYLYADKHNYSGRLIVYQNFPDGSPARTQCEKEGKFLDYMMNSLDKTQNR